MDAPVANVRFVAEMHPEVRRTVDRLINLYNSWDEVGACHADKYCDESGKTCYHNYSSKTELQNSIFAIACGICIQFSD